MIAEARAEKKVIRLQSGDPLVYGRAGEEMEALRNAGISFEVVPGVTAAFAAAASAKIPLMGKRVASRVIFLSAHSCKRDALPDLGPGVSTDSTLAIYMPGQDYASLQKQLLASGLPSTAPCLVVCRASQPGESLHATFLGRLAVAHPAAAPSILLVGELAGVSENYSLEATSEIAFVS
jgi:siroheme synthase